MRSLAVVVVVLGALMVPASASAARGFQTPSGNIACVSDGRTLLRCDIREHAWAPPPRPAWCDFDWGGGFSLRPTGGARYLCVSDAIGRRAVLRYGRTWRAGPFRCTSRATGLICKNRRNHGFTMSRLTRRRF